MNAFPPGASPRTGAVSRSEAGRHTTTHARLYRLGDGVLIDSPGMHRFGLSHIAPTELAHCFVEFRAWLGQCRFNDCRHLDEPGCALGAALRRGEVRPERMQSYRKLMHSLAATRSASRRSEPARNRQQPDDEEP